MEIDHNPFDLESMELPFDRKNETKTYPNSVESLTQDQESFVIQQLPQNDSNCELFEENFEFQQLQYQQSIQIFQNSELQQQQQQFYLNEYEGEQYEDREDQFEEEQNDYQQDNEINSSSNNNRNDSTKKIIKGQKKVKSKYKNYYVKKADKMKQIRQQQEIKQRKQCSLVATKLVFIPNKLIPLIDSYLLKNNGIIVEKFVQNPELALQNMENINTKNFKNESDIETQQLLSQFKYIDYIIHSNKDSISANKPEFIELKLVEYKNTAIPSQYIIDRFLSFGDIRFKQLADMVQQLDLVYEKFLQSKYNTAAANSDSQLINSKIGEHVNKKLSEIYQQYTGQPVHIEHFRAGFNQRITDMQTQSMNKDFIKLLQFSIPQFIQIATKRLGLPPYSYMVDIISLTNVRQNYIIPFLTTKIIPQDEVIMPYQSLFYKTQFGNILTNFQIRVKFVNDGLNQYVVYITEIIEK